MFQYYSATWNIQRNTLTQGQLFYTGTSYGFVPDGWRQERATFDGQSFTYIREGQERRSRCRKPLRTGAVSSALRRTATRRWWCI